MWTNVTRDTKHVTDYQFRRVTIDLGCEDIRQEVVACQDLEDFLGGIGRSFKLLGHAVAWAASWGQKTSWPL